MMARRSSTAVALVLCIAPAAALRSRRTVHTPHIVRAPRLLRALRGGATAELMWVRHGDGPVQLVRSFSAFCKDHVLDEKAMLAVSRGEAKDYEGWTCGVPEEVDPPKTTAKAAVQAEEVSEDDEDEAEVTDMNATADADGAAAAAAPKPPAPQMGKTMIGFIAPMVVLNVLKRFDQKSTAFTQGLRAAFFGLIALNTLVQLLIDWRIKARNDQTLVKVALNPIMMLMGGAGAQRDETAACYDKKTLNSMRNSYRMGCLFSARARH